jgi:DNA-binding transcriptional MerR regulator
VELNLRLKKLYRIGEVSQITGVETHVLRYWEAAFKIVRPNRQLSKQRLYRQDDVDLILEIKRLLYEEKYTLSGVKRYLAERRTPSDLPLPAKKSLEPPPPPDQPTRAELLASIRAELKAIQNILTKSSPSS